MWACVCVFYQEETTPYSFFVNEREIVSSLVNELQKQQLDGSEAVIDIVYQPQAVFRVRAVTRCTSSIPGHADAILTVQFSPNGR